MASTRVMAVGMMTKGQIPELCKSKSDRIQLSSGFSHIRIYRIYIRRVKDRHIVTMQDV